MKKKKKPRIFNYTINNRYPQKKRADIMTRRMLGRKYSVYNGRHHIVVIVTSARLGTPFGDYSPTRVSGNYPAKKKRK